MDGGWQAGRYKMGNFRVSACSVVLVVVLQVSVFGWPAPGWAGYRYAAPAIAPDTESIYQCCITEHTSIEDESSAEDSILPSVNVASEAANDCIVRSCFNREGAALCTNMDVWMLTAATRHSYSCGPPLA